jgi:DNA-binding transcriptional LysR family regulator
MREQGSKTRRIVEETAKKEGVKLQATIEAEGREAVREIVASGAGVGFVSSAEFDYDKRLVEIPISGHNLQMDEALICLKERNNGKLIRSFMQMARGL